jgi:hypothetical protein
MNRGPYICVITKSWRRCVIVGLRVEEEEEVEERKGAVDDIAQYLNVPAPAIDPASVYLSAFALAASGR